jgi:transposase InsO family protein
MLHRLRVLASGYGLKADSRVGNPYDNAKAESFMKTLKQEENPAYWSVELFFVDVPIKGQSRNTLHVILPEVAERNVPSKIIKRMGLALATKPYDVFYLCHIPTQNLDNAWNTSSLIACQAAQTA